MKIPLSHIRARAKERPAGYLEELLSRGTVVGEVLELSDNAYRELAVKYDPRGLGDIVARIAGPIGKALGIEDCEGCAERQEWLNEKFPFGGAAPTARGK